MQDASLNTGIVLAQRLLCHLAHTNTATISIANTTTATAAITATTAATTSKLVIAGAYSSVLSVVSSQGLLLVLLDRAATCIASHTCMYFEYSDYLVYATAFDSITCSTTVASCNVTNSMSFNVTTPYATTNAITSTARLPLLLFISLYFYLFVFSDFPLMLYFVIYIFVIVDDGHIS